MYLPVGTTAFSFGGHLQVLSFWLFEVRVMVNSFQCSEESEICETGEITFEQLFQALKVNYLVCCCQFRCPAFLEALLS